MYSFEEVQLVGSPCWASSVSLLRLVRGKIEAIIKKKEKTVIIE
jgi:hypothetical protein